jgi:nicotinamide-nucleotide amidase
MRAKVSKLKEGFLRRGLTLTVAESMTGGALSNIITSVPGASGFFLGGMVSYSPKLKAMVGVPKATITKYGAYSQEVATKLATGSLQRFGSDVAVGITGQAHPDKTHRSPGAWVVVTFGKKVLVKHVVCKPTIRRNEAKKRVAMSAVDLLLEMLRTKF